MSSKFKNKITLLDVAKHAGVSRATASLVARDSAKVSPGTRKKVRNSMNQLGYVYDRVAANLRSQRSTTIGVIITNIENTFFSRFLLGVHREFEKYGYTVLLGTSFDNLKSQEQLISTMLENQVGGIILCPASGSSLETAKRINNLTIPVVVGIRELERLTVDYVGLDYITGSNKAVNYLLQTKKHEKVAFIGGIVHSSTWEERIEGYQTAHENFGVAINNSLIIPSEPTKRGGYAALIKLSKKNIKPTAIFCFNDLVAFGVIKGLRDLGYIPGKDIDIVGFDNISESEISYPSLTTVSAFAKQSGEKAAKLLQSRIEKPNQRRKRILLQPKLIKRESS